MLVPWLSYARTMPAADVVVTHGGHGTLVRALSCGCALVVCPAGGDMAENAARADWAGLGVRLPRRLLGPRTLRLAVRRALGDPAMRARARAVAGLDRGARRRARGRARARGAGLEPRSPAPPAAVHAGTAGRSVRTQTVAPSASSS